MEDEDDVPKAVDPPTLEQAPSEAPLSEQPEIPEQCRRSSTVGAPVEPPPVATTEGEAEPPPVAERLAGEGEGEVVEAVETDEREMEGVNDGEPEAIVEERDKLVQEGSEGEGNADEAVKVEELPQVTEDLEPKNEETGGEIEETAEQGTQTKESLGETEGDTVVEAEELLPVTEKVEVATTEDMAAEEADKQEENESKGVEGSSEGKEAAKQEEIESESVEGDVKGQMAVNEEEEGSKGDEEVFGETAEDKHDIEGDGDGVLVIKQEEDDSKGGVGGDAEVQVMVNDGDNLSKPDEGMTVGMVEDEQELQGDGKEQLVAEQEEDESKGAGEDDVEGQVEVNEEEEEEEFKGDEEMEGEGEAEELNDSQVNDIASSPVVMKDEELTGEGEMPTADAEMEVEGEVVKSGSGGKRRRGRNSKAAPTRTLVRKTAGEDVCFICLDGGDLVLCDRRGCPKAYHPSCVDHDEEFFKTKDRWTCGWHLCNKCGKNAYFMCYTCTFSLCKGCCKGAVVFCVRGNKGFCESCMKTVMMIESTEQNEGQVAFDDKSSWEYLFKDYWIEQKRRFSITSDELAQARNPWKSSDATDKQQSGGDVHIGDNDVGTESDSTENLEVTDSKRKKAKRKSKIVDSDTDSSTEKDASTAKRKAKRKSKSQIKEAYSDSEHSSGNDDASNKKGKRPRRLSKSRGKARNTISAANIEVSAEGAAEWASKELLEFVMHMKDGDKSVLTQFDVQGLLLEYIKRNKLRDPRRRSQIICDPMLQKLFGKPRVGHFEMLKLLESHFLLKEDSQADDNHGSVVDEVSQVDADDNTDSTLEASRSKGRKSRKRGEDRGLPSNLDDYAAIDMHNINLIYLRRNLMEALMEDSEMFHDKVVGSFVRIRISGTNQKQDIYRLVQIIGTSKAAEPYRVGKRTTDVMLEILNLDKTEIISIDTISNQEFTEDECKRLRQSIKCGLISRMTVGDVLEKARELQEVRVTDWLEAEIVRLSHLRDRASEKGRKKELRECVEKLQLLKTPEERQRRLEEIPEVHADPKMDPSCESEDESEMDNRRQASIMRPRESGFFRRERDHFSSRKGSNDSWSANARPPNKNRELSRNSSGKGFSSRKEDTIAASQTYEPSWNNGVDKGTTGGWEKPRLTSDPVISARTEYSGVRSDVSATASEASQPPSAGTLQADAKVNEAEKIWHYRDPTSKVQGPFSMSQLRKWSNTGYFPADLRIWKASRSEDDSILLTEALAGRFQKESTSVGLLSDVSSKPGNAPSSIENSRDSLHARGSEYGVRYDPSNLPSPTPGRTTAGWGGKQTSESKWSTSSPFRSNNQSQGGNERLPSPTPTSPASVPSAGRPHFSQQSKDSGMMGIKEENSTASIMATASVTNSAGQFLSIAVPVPVVSVNSGSINAQQIPSQSGGHAANQAFVPGDAGMNLANLRPDANIAAQGFSNVVQPSAMQNPSVYNTQGWAPGSVPRPDIVNANMMASNSSSVASQVSYGQWPGAPVANQASSYSAGYPPPGNMASNFPGMPSQSAWRPTSTNMPWAGQPPQPMNPNMGWAEPPSAAAFGPPAGAMGQLAGATPGASAVPSGNTMSGWPGTGSAPAGGNVNPGWVAPSGNASTWGGDQNRRGSGGAQWNRQSSFGGGGGGGPGTPRGQGVCRFHENGHCKKGAACNYMHT